MLTKTIMAVSQLNAEIAITQKYAIRDPNSRKLLRLAPAGASA